MVVSPAALFRPFSYKSLHLPNRVVMAPMTRLQSPGGVPGQEMAQYYRRRAEGGVGLIITEGVTVDRPSASFDVNIPNLHDERSIAAWRHIVAEVQPQPVDQIEGQIGGGVAEMGGVIGSDPAEVHGGRRPGRYRTHLTVGAVEEP